MMSRSSTEGHRCAWRPSSAYCRRGTSSSQHGRPIAIVCSHSAEELGPPAVSTRATARRQRRETGRNRVAVLHYCSPDPRWHYTGGLSGGAEVRVGCGQVGHDRHCDSRIHPPEVQVTSKCPGGEKKTEVHSGSPNLAGPTGPAKRRLGQLGLASQRLASTQDS